MKKWRKWQKSDEKLKEEVERKGLKLSVTEHGKEDMRTRVKKLGVEEKTRRKKC